MGNISLLLFPIFYHVIPWPLEPDLRTVIIGMFAVSSATAPDSCLILLFFLSVVHQVIVFSAPLEFMLP